MQHLLHYRIRHSLGRGGSSEALLAHDELLNRDVVLKVLVSPNLDAGVVEREARILAQLSHPNIAGVHALESTPTERFLVLEYVDGDTLDHVLSGGPLPPEAITALAHTILSALAHAHARGVLHRDLKPDNIMIAHDGTVKLTDFGVAHLAGLPGELTAGVSLYQSPEQAAGGPMDSRSDLYSMALVLAECAVGSRLARQPGVPLPPERIEGVAERLPVPVRSIVTRCLAARPEDRPASALESLALLDAGIAVTRRSGLLRAAAVAAALGLALLAVAARFEWGPVAHVTDPATLAIVCATPERPDRRSDVLSEAFASAVSAHLAQGSSVRLLHASLGPRLHTDDLVTLAAVARAQGAGRILLVDLKRRGSAVSTHLTLFDSRNRRLLWTDTRMLEPRLLPRAVAAAARDVARQLGMPDPRHYDWFLHTFADTLLNRDATALAALEAARGTDVARMMHTTRAFRASHPASVDARVLYAYACLSANWTAGPQDRASRAAFRASLDSLRAADPSSPWDEALDAAMMSRDGQLDAAIVAFGGVLAHPALGPSARAMVLALRGQALRDRGDGAAALRDLREAVAIDGTNVLTLVMLADALGTFSHPAEGLRVAEQALMIAPASSYSHIAMAHACVRVGDWARAEAAIREGHRLAPSMDTRALLALILLKRGWPEAESVWGRSILARYHAARGDLDTAFDHLRRAVRLGFADPEVERMAEFDALRAEPRFAAMWPLTPRQR